MDFVMAWVASFSAAAVAVGAAAVSVVAVVAVVAAAGVALSETVRARFDGRGRAAFGVVVVGGALLFSAAAGGAGGAGAEAEGGGAVVVVVVVPSNSDLPRRRAPVGFFPRLCVSPVRPAEEGRGTACGGSGIMPSDVLSSSSQLIAASGGTPPSGWPPSGIGWGGGCVWCVGEARLFSCVRFAFFSFLVVVGGREVMEVMEVEKNTKVIFLCLDCEKKNFYIFPSAPPLLSPPLPLTPQPYGKPRLDCAKGETHKRLECRFLRSVCFR